MMAKLRTNILAAGLVALLVTIHQAEAGCFSGPSNGLSQINEFLVKKVDSDDVSKNMAAAIEWLSSTGTMKNLMPFASKPPVEALQKFVSLMNILDPAPTCSKRTFDILRSLDEYTSRINHKPASELIHPRRVDLIINDYATKHAQGCTEIHLKLISDQSAKMDQEKLRRVEVYSEAIANSKCNSVASGKKPCEKPGSRVIFLIHRVHSVVGHDDVKATYEALEQLTSEDQRAKCLHRTVDLQQNTFNPVDEDCVKQLVNEYLVEPCSHYREQLGELAERSYYDYEIIKDWYEPSKEDMYSVWYRDRICKLLLSQQTDGLLGLLVYHIPPTTT